MKFNHCWTKTNEEKQEKNTQQYNEEISTEVRNVADEIEVLTEHEIIHNQSVKSQVSTTEENSKQNFKLKQKRICGNITVWLWWLLVIIGLALNNMITYIVKVVEYLTDISTLIDLLKATLKFNIKTARLKNASKHFKGHKSVSQKNV